MHIFNNQLKMFRSQITRERGVDALIGLQLQATVRVVHTIDFCDFHALFAR